MRLINNTNKPNDRMRTFISQQGKNTDVYIASAFFSDHGTLLDMVKNGCEIRLIIRLGMGTSSESLKAVFENDKIHIRFFTGRSFHPKFYIFGNRIAYIGSSNFTNAGLLTNQEANVEIDSDEPIFEELQKQFEDYWESAEVLTEEGLLTFIDIMKDFQPRDPSPSIKRKIGEHEYNNVGRDGTGQTKEALFSSNFKREYQRYIAKFNILKGIYSETKIRRFEEIPLRVEVDRFLWWIREEKAQREDWNGVPEKQEDTIRVHVHKLAKEFLSFESNYLEHEAVPKYMDIAKSFKDLDSMKKLTLDQLYDSLLNVHAFHDRFRYFEGGHSKMKEEFLGKNDHGKIRSTLEYLLFGSGEYVNRISNCIFNTDYKLHEFGKSCVKELFGLINDKKIPICNSRTLKSMEWLGFGKLM